MVKITDEKGNTFFADSVCFTGKVWSGHKTEMRDKCDAKTAVNFFLLLDRILGKMAVYGARAEIIEMNSILFENLKELAVHAPSAPRISEKSEWYIWHLKVKINEELKDDTICVYGDK